ncbi:MAG: ABC transporter ATP-binding protein [Nocardioides sp.]
MTRVVVNGLAAGFSGTPVLEGVDLDLSDGTVGVALGPSGSGKSTLLRAIAGLHRPTAGEIWLGDRRVSSPRSWVPPESRGVGLVPQHGSLFPHLSVAENISFGLGRRPSGEARARMSDLIAIAGLGALVLRMPHELSGGQKQRVALMRALAPDPAVVLLDEPFGALDAGLREELRDDVVRLLRASGTTSLIVTHDQGEALSVAERLFVIREGAIAQAGTPRELFERPGTDWIAGFLGAGTLYDATATDGAAATPWGRLPLATVRSGRVRVLIRPEQVELSTLSPGSSAGMPVVQRRYYGHDQVLVVEDPATRALLSARINSGDGPSPGDVVAVRVRGPVACFDSPADVHGHVREP